MLLFIEFSAFIFPSYLNEMFGLVEQAQGGVPGAVGAHRHDIFQLLQAVPQMSSSVLFRLSSEVDFTS